MDGRCNNLGDMRKKRNKRQIVLEDLAESFYKWDTEAKPQHSHCITCSCDPKKNVKRLRRAKRVNQLRKLFKIKTAFTAQYPRYNALKSVEHPAIIRQLKILVKEGYLSEQKYNGKHTLYSFTKKANRVFGRNRNE